MFPSTRLLLVWGFGVLVLCGIVAVLIGAADGPDEAWTRLRTMSPELRSHLTENMKRFHQVLTPEQQKSLRQLDQRIGKLAPQEKAHSLARLSDFF